MVTFRVAESSFSSSENKVGGEGFRMGTRGRRRRRGVRFRGGVEDEQVWVRGRRDLKPFNPLR